MIVLQLFCLPKNMLKFVDDVVYLLVQKEIQNLSNVVCCVWSYKKTTQ